MQDALEKNPHNIFRPVEREKKDAQPNLDDRDVISVDWLLRLRLRVVHGSE